MVKKLSLALLFSTFYIFSATVFASNALNPPIHSPLPAFACAAPPPDSFRVTSIGYHFVSVAWNPVWPGADHILTILEENTSGSWDSLYSVTLINTTSYSVTNTMPTKRYQFKIRTLCNNGDPSSFWTGLNPPFGLILELTTAGRNPIAPNPNGCTGMDYVANEWIGFELSRRDGENGIITSLFEFVKDDNPDDKVVGIIKRVESENILVAANHQNEWPDPEVKTLGLQFRVGEITNFIDFDVFGFINVNIHPATTTVDICQELNDPLKPWDPTYSFNPMVASEVEEPFCPTCPIDDLPGGLGRMTKDSKNVLIKVQSPVSEYLKVFFPKSGFISGIYQIELIDINGNICIKEQIDVQAQQISIPIGKISPGFYIFQIETNGLIQSYKLVVSK